MEIVSKPLVAKILKEDTEKIYSLIDSQKQHLCFASCPAFDEVVDTQLFGLSKQIEFAIKLGVLEKEEGYLILSNLEKSLNNMYSSYYKQMKNLQVKGE